MNRREKVRKKKQHTEEHVDESWLIPYADMLTLLLALFIVLFAMSEIDAQKYKELSQVFKSEFASGNGTEGEGVGSSTAPSEDVEETEVSNDSEVDKGIEELYHLQVLQDEINQYIGENNLAKVLGTELTDEGLLIVILNDVFFDSGSAKVKAGGREIADEVAQFLYTDPPHQIVVSGHTDNQPIQSSEFSSNWELSVMRAVNFMQLLLENENLGPERFSAKGYGEQKPTVSNSDEANRAKNRRVEVLVLPNYEINTGGIEKE
ncbi:flagellar motor protein MotB [Aquibacillus rhizosphaerae]|uniref:Flagellar motor protein MotB n=1 Tax=Aquibacillus rhizosphaerae TaxID=3051431 RepID=A0ABT7L414_9BACI|nr:flagellar motor protein MotB [Aquibacillus sp. LR5S19]MDL4840594.1 flagellar motor protein MotB [Aquibacillus sp. LR5S19]